MATRGIKQLQNLTIHYCEHGGSSAQIREFLLKGKILPFAQSNPTVTIATSLRNGHHPYIAASYKSGFDKQICVKNEPKDRIAKVLWMLNNSSGRKIVKLSGAGVKTDTPSVQGVWTPMLDIVNQPFKIDIVD